MQFKCMLLILFLVLLPVVSWTDIHTAVSTSYADVSAAINAATTGDTVVVPPGSSTWTNALLVKKGIYLLGAGVGSTVITRGGPLIIEYIPADYGLNSPFRLAGFSFNGAGGSILVLGEDIIVAKPANTEIRIDHNRFYSSSTTTFDIWAVKHKGQMFGVVDNNTFDNYVYPMRSDAAYGSVLWDKWGMEGYTYTPGDKYNLYFEDNTINLSNTDTACIVTDSQFSGRYCYRYNLINSSVNGQPFFDVHGIQSDTMHSPFGCEHYGNRFVVTGGTLLQTRGGVNLVHHNSFTNALGLGVSTSMVICPLEPYRSLEMIHDTYFFLNRLDYSGTLSAADRDDAGISCGGRTRPDYGKDFFDETTTPAVTYGTLANRPTTCSVGQAYWATNQSNSDLTGMVGVNPTTPIQGTLYICTATNVWGKSYTPYTYPHPLRGEISSVPPEPPTNIRIK